jgi:hypothetical protein
LKQHHKVAAITATCYDSVETLREKYSGVQSTIDMLTEAHAAKTSSTEHEHQIGNRGGDADWEGFSPVPSSQSSAEDEALEPKSSSIGPRVTVLYDIDATKLSTAHKKALRKMAPFSKIVFSFPHVGGLVRFQFLPWPW